MPPRKRGHEGEGRDALRRQGLGRAGGAGRSPSIMVEDPAIAESSLSLRQLLAPGIERRSTWPVDTYAVRSALQEPLKQKDP